MCCKKKDVGENIKQELHDGLAVILIKLGGPSDGPPTQTHCHRHLVLFRHLQRRELDRIQDPWNPQKGCDEVGINRNQDLVDEGVERIYLKIIVKDIQVKDLNDFIMDESLERKQWQPATSIDMLVELDGAEGIKSHGPLDH